MQGRLVKVGHGKLIVNLPSGVYFLQVGDKRKNCDNKMTPIFLIASIVFRNGDITNETL